MTSPDRERVTVYSPAVDFDLQVKLAIYSHFAETGRRASPMEISVRLGSNAGEVMEAYRRLRAQRVLVLEYDGSSIRMAPPFSGVPTQHVVKAGGISYFANCAWDALGIPAALHKPAMIHSRCEQSREPLRLDVGLAGPEPSDAGAGARAGGTDWLFHCLVPAAKWWDDIVFT